LSNNKKMKMDFTRRTFMDKYITNINGDIQRKITGARVRIHGYIYQSENLLLFHRDCTEWKAQIYLKSTTSFIKAQIDRYI